MWSIHIPAPLEFREPLGLSSRKRTRQMKFLQSSLGRAMAISAGSIYFIRQPHGEINARLATIERAISVIIPRTPTRGWRCIFHNGIRSELPAAAEVGQVERIVIRIVSG